MATRKENIKLTISAKDKAGKKLSSIQKKIIGIGAAYLGWKAVTGIISDIVKAGIEHEKVWTDVEASLKRHNIAVESTIKSIKMFSDEMQTLSGVSDEVIGKATQAFIDYGQDAEGAMDTVRVAMDLAAGGSMDMMAAVDLLAKASVGYTGTLSRYGIIIDESIPKAEKFAAAIEQINEKFGGAAQARADTMAVKMALISQKFGDLKEEIFKLFSPAMLSGIETGISLVSGFINIISEWNKETEEVRTEAGKAVDKFHDWTEQLKNLRIQFQDGTIDLETFRKEMENIGKATGESITPEQIALINEAGEALGKAADATGSWAIHAGFTNEQLTEMYDQIEKIKAQKAFEEAQRQAYLLTLRTKGLTDAQIEFLYSVERSHETFVVETEKVILNIKKLEGAVQDTTEILADEMLETAQVWNQSMGTAVNGMVSQMQGAEVDMKRIFKQMALDFIRLFVKQALSAMAFQFVNPFLGFLKLFDKAANDRMAMQQGERFVGFFSQGAQRAMTQMNLAPAIVSVPISGFRAFDSNIQQRPNIQISLTVNGSITSEGLIDHVIRDIVPIIEHASDRRETRLSKEPFMQTGESSAVIA